MDYSDGSYKQYAFADDVEIQGMSPAGFGPATKRIQAQIQSVYILLATRQFQEDGGLDTTDLHRLPDKQSALGSNCRWVVNSTLISKKIREKTTEKITKPSDSLISSVDTTENA